MNLKHVLLALICVYCPAPLYGMKVKPKDVLKFWRENLIKKQIVTLKKDCMVTQFRFDPKKEIILFEYLLKTGEKFLSFSKRTASLSTLNKIIMYRQNGEYFAPIAHDCKGMPPLEEVLSQANVVSNDGHQARLHYNERSLLVYSPGFEKVTVIDKPEDEYPFEVINEGDGRVIQKPLPYYSDAVMSHDGNRVLAIKYDNTIIECVLDSDYSI